MMTTENPSLIAGQANFAFNLLQQTTPNKSTVISPISISNALGMILLGAENNTADEIRNAIFRGVDANEIHQHFSELYAFIEGLNQGKDLDEKLPLFYKNEVVKNRKVKMAVKVYFAEGTRFKDAYENGITKFYNGNYETVDFQNSEKAAADINKFVEKATDEEIKDMVDPDMFGEYTKLVAVNALLFEGKWENPFTLRVPSKMMFYSSPDLSNEISMMETDIYCRYIMNEQFQFLEMPYSSKAFSMYLILPHERYGLLSLLETLNTSQVLEMMSSANNNLIDGKIIIPKFELSSSFNLKQILKNLNINDAFDEKEADFSGISDECMHVTRTLHKAFINVFEDGTKAGAATLIEEEDMMFAGKTEPKFEFIADHPFLYLIADKAKNIYFIGTFYNN